MERGGSLEGTGEPPAPLMALSTHCFVISQQLELLQTSSSRFQLRAWSLLHRTQTLEWTPRGQHPGAIRTSKHIAIESMPQPMCKHDYNVCEAAAIVTMRLALGLSYHSVISRKPSATPTC